jgi:hypothetical protein
VSGVGAWLCVVVFDSACCCTTIYVVFFLSVGAAPAPPLCLSRMVARLGSGFLPLVVVCIVWLARPFATPIVTPCFHACRCKVTYKNPKAVAAHLERVHIASDHVQALQDALSAARQRIDSLTKELKAAVRLFRWWWWWWWWWHEERVRVGDEQAQPTVFEFALSYKTTGPRTRVFP